MYEYVLMCENYLPIGADREWTTCPLHADECGFVPVPIKDFTLPWVYRVECIKVVGPELEAAFVGSHEPLSECPRCHRCPISRVENKFIAIPDWVIDV